MIRWAHRCTLVAASLGVLAGCASDSPKAPESSTSTVETEWDHSYLKEPSVDGRYVEAHFDRALTTESLKALAKSGDPKSMDDRWIVILKPESIDFTRSWSGQHCYRVMATRTNTGADLGPLLINPEFLAENPDRGQAVRHAHQLIDHYCKRHVSAERALIDE